MANGIARYTVTNGLAGCRRAGGSAVTIYAVAYLRLTKNYIVGGYPSSGFIPDMRYAQPTDCYWIVPGTIPDWE